MYRASQTPNRIAGRPGLRPFRSLRWPGPGRIALLALLCTAVLSTSGCVFLRLLELKNQLAEFDRNFAVDHEDGLTLRFLHPVLLERDMWLLGLPPTLREPSATGVTWTLIFEKLHPAPPSEPPEFDLSVTLRFAEGKLAAFHLGEEYFALIPKQAVLMTIKSLGKVEIDTAGRQAVLEIEESHGPEWDFKAPKRSDIVATLGSPWLEEEADDDGTTLEYRYRLRKSEDRTGSARESEAGGDYLLRIAFSKTDDILNVSGTLPLVGRIHVDYE